ncbi:unnamed protein product [Prorocentrum cordatum]|uniref:Aspartyl/asparaginy/proline hydroxylase domain-containing protein n=1 Tax=Prorocentrum cordatum TaxID=2364126 RepID=A0ABN9PFT2_9DINO|nr:unnamed protein product [Polarella glacialis]
MDPSPWRAERARSGAGGAPRGIQRRSKKSARSANGFCFFYGLFPEKNVFTGHLDPTLKGAITSEFWPSFEPLLRPLARLIKGAYGMRQPMVWKAMLARLPAGKSITEHSDASPVLNFPHRIHWVLHTNRDVETNCAVEDGDVPTPIPDIGEGDVFELNNVHRHSVHNRGSEGRVHLIVDVYPHSLKDAGVESSADGIDLLSDSPRTEL